MERTETLLPIGRFSRLCGLTVKALRHYDDIHLLRPARVDESTGYRYYSVEQLAEAGAIARLRELDVPLEECRTILAERDPEAARRSGEPARCRRSAREGRGEGRCGAADPGDQLTDDAGGPRRRDLEVD